MANAVLIARVQSASAQATEKPIYIKCFKAGKFTVIGMVLGILWQLPTLSPKLFVVAE